MEKRKKVYAKEKKPRSWIATIALIVSILSFAYTVINSQLQNSRLQEAEFINQSLQAKPLLTIVEKPEVKRIEYEVKVEMLNDKVINSNANKLKVDTRIRIRNDGNANAHLILYGVTDRLSGLPEIRDAIVSKFKDFPGKVKMELIKDYYKTMDILPGKEQTLESSIDVKNIKGGLFNLHYYLVYKNEIGNAYDTYYWARFKSNEFTINPNADNESVKKAIMNSIVFVDDHYSYKIFNREESLYLSDLSDSVDKDSKK